MFIFQVRFSIPSSVTRKMFSNVPNDSLAAYIDEERSLKMTNTRLQEQNIKLTNILAGMRPKLSQSEASYAKVLANLHGNEADLKEKGDLLMVGGKRCDELKTKLKDIEQEKGDLMLEIKRYKDQLQNQKREGI